MQIIKNIAVPTGNICVVQGNHGKLEMLSIGDYGKDVNLKADFMGLERKPSPVRHTAMLPLEEKWVITVSTQYGCSMGCKFCDVPKVGPGINSTFNDLVGQVLTGIELHPEVKSTKRLNVHFARMGEPTFNTAVLDATIYLAGMLKSKGWGFHPVVSTMMPAENNGLQKFLRDWMRIKNDVLDGDAGLQISFNTTDWNEKRKMFNGNDSSPWGIDCLMDGLIPKGRKITINFALGGWKIDPDILLEHFNPAHYLCKLTPLHRTRAVNNKDMMPPGDWTEYTPYEETEAALKKAGYDVIVFIASKEEDESRITCGNAILADKAQ